MALSRQINFARNPSLRSLLPMAPLSVRLRAACAHAAAMPGDALSHGSSRAQLLAEYDGPRGGPPTPCRLKIFVYNTTQVPTARAARLYDGWPCPNNCSQNLSIIEEMLWTERHYHFKHYGVGKPESPAGSEWAGARRGSCLLPNPSCQYRGFGTGDHNKRAFSMELALYTRLVESCEVVADAREADAFVMPAFMSTIMTMGWGNNKRGVLARHLYDFTDGRRFGYWRWMPHLTPRTLPRHLIFYGGDSSFLPHDLPHGRGLVVHLGDVHYPGNPFPGKRAVPGAPDVHPSVRERRLRDDLVVPYRISQWLPLGFPPRLPAHHNRSADGAFGDRSAVVRHKHRLLYANLNSAKHPLRAELARSLTREAAALGLRGAIDLTPSMTTVAAAAHAAMTSLFCLCPTGDSTGFTARLYFSLVHGCIPVFVDLWQRAIGFDDLALPFPRAIDWRRAVLFRGFNATGNLLAELHRIAGRRGELHARLHYLRNISHWLVSEVPGVRDDAPAAFVRELEARFLGAAEREKARERARLAGPGDADDCDRRGATTSEARAAFSAESVRDCQF